MNKTLQSGFLATFKATRLVHELQNDMPKGTGLPHCIFVLKKWSSNPTCCLIHYYQMPQTCTNLNFTNATEILCRKKSMHNYLYPIQV